MGENAITIRPDDQIFEFICSLADYHDTSRSQAAQLLILEGFHSREQRLRFEQLNTKVNLLLENSGLDELVEDDLEEDFAEILGTSPPAERLALDLADRPHPAFYIQELTPQSAMEQLNE